MGGVTSVGSVYLCFPFLTGPVCLMWILGHLYVHWRAKRALVRQEGRQLGFPREEASVHWIGILGMCFLVLPEVQHRSPDMLLLHVGGNDSSIRTSRDLIRNVK